jgi:hypothetical protein
MEKNKASSVNDENCSDLEKKQTGFIEKLEEVGSKKKKVIRDKPKFVCLFWYQVARKMQVP